LSSTSDLFERDVVQTLVAYYMLEEAVAMEESGRVAEVAELFYEGDENRASDNSSVVTIGSGGYALRLRDLPQNPPGRVELFGNSRTLVSVRNPFDYGKDCIPDLPDIADLPDGSMEVLDYMVCEPTLIPLDGRVDWVADYYVCVAERIDELSDDDLSSVADVFFGGDKEKAKKNVGIYSEPSSVFGEWTFYLRVRLPDVESFSSSPDVLVCFGERCERFRTGLTTDPCLPSVIP